MTQKANVTTYVNPEEFKKVLSHYINKRVYIIAGSSSIFIPSEKRRFTDISVCKRWPNAEGGLELVTPSQAARIELAREWPGLKKVGWPGKQYGLLSKNPPMYFSGPSRGEFIYIDLVSAYCQLYEKLWLDVAYPRSVYGRYPLADVANRLEPWKVARNSLIGICRAKSITGYKNGTRMDIAAQNRYLSPPLWATVVGLLHWIARKALDHGAIYVNSDGYIFPTNEWLYADRFMSYLTENEITFHIRAAGEGNIRCWNNYRIGQVSTSAYRLNLQLSERSFTNVYSDDERTWAAYWNQVRRIYAARNGIGPEASRGETHLHQIDTGHGSVRKSYSCRPRAE